MCYEFVHFLHCVSGVDKFLLPSSCSQNQGSDLAGGGSGRLGKRCHLPQALGQNLFQQPHGHLREAKRRLSFWFLFFFCLKQATKPFGLLGPRSLISSCAQTPVDKAPRSQHASTMHSACFIGKPPVTIRLIMDAIIVKQRSLQSAYPLFVD